MHINISQQLYMYIVIFLFVLFGYLFCSIYFIYLLIFLLPLLDDCFLMRDRKKG